jgi:hypothetical protein
VSPAVVWGDARRADLPELAAETVRAFCISDFEVEPITEIRRRRISLVDVKIERARLHE